MKRSALATKSQLKINQPLKAKTVLKAHTGLKKRRKKGVNQVAIDLARSIWRLRGYCEDCGEPGTKVQLHGAHIYGVGAFRRIGSDLRNGMCLCSSCHRRWEDDPGWKDFVLAHPLGKYYNALRVLESQALPNWLDRIDFLKEIKRAIIAGEMTIEKAWEYEP